MHLLSLGPMYEFLSLLIMRTFRTENETETYWMHLACGCDCHSETGTTESRSTIFDYYLLLLDCTDVLANLNWTRMRTIRSLRRLVITNSVTKCVYFIERLINQTLLLEPQVNSIKASSQIWMYFISLCFSSFDI